MREIHYAVLILYMISFLINIYYLVCLYGRFAFHKPSTTLPYKKKENAVSVIVCAHNEAENLRKYLPHVLNQEYKKFEVIVVDDRSTDNSFAVLEGFKKKYGNLRIIRSEENPLVKGKKNALGLGIKSAMHDIVLLTDADCKPLSKKWIDTIQKHYSCGKTKIVLAYSPYGKTQGFLNSFIRFETFMTALSYFSFALAGQPYMGVGRNLSYKRDLFFEHKGFSSHSHLLSGDDDLFINRASDSRNTSIEYSTDSLVISEPKNTWKSFFRQKIRHISAGSFYKTYHKLMLSLRAGSYICFVLLFCTLLVFKIEIQLSLSIFLLYIVVLSFVYGRAMKKLYVKDLCLFAFPLEMLYYFYLLILALLIPKNGKLKTWK